MRPTTQLPPHRLSAVALLLAAVSCPAVSSADTIWLKSGTGKALPLPDIKIQKVDGATLTYTSESSGNEGRKSLDSVSRIKLDDEPPFSAAEEAYDSGNLKAAIESYRKAIDATSRPWVKSRAGTRLVDAGNKTKDLPGAVAGYIALLGVDPVAASKHPVTAAADAPKESFTAAISALKQAKSGVKGDQKDQLLNLLAQLQTAAKDTAGAGETLKELGKSDGSSGNTAGAGAAASSGDGNRVKADLKINEGKLALSAKNYKQAIDAIEGNSPLFTESDQQAEALFIVAEAKAGTAGNDPKLLADAGIAYMRVVANFKSLSGAPHVADSLLKTAQIEEKLGKPEEALKVYTDVTEEFKDSPAAKTAADGVSRLKKG